MKTPETIKKALNICIQHDMDKCVECPYDKKCGRKDEGLLQDIIALIEQLEETISLMKIQMHGDCGVCKHRKHTASETCAKCLASKADRPNWEYEGLPEVNSK